MDVHSHLVFGVDDGAQSLDDAVDLMTEARATGTRLVFATPHIVPPYLQWDASRARLARIQRNFAALQARAPAGLEVRLGFEVTARPHRLRADDDPGRFRLEGTEFVLMDGPQAGPWVGDSTMERLVRRIRAEGEAEHAAIGHAATAALVDAPRAFLLRAAMRDHDADFARFYNVLADVLE